MRRVIIESPFAGDIERNVRYARAAVADALHRGEAPLASHLLYTQPGVLGDSIPGERALGIAAGHEWIRVADAVVVYTDLGYSQGMNAGIARAFGAGVPVEFRTVPGWIRAEEERAAVAQYVGNQGGGGGGGGGGAVITNTHHSSQHGSPYRCPSSLLLAGEFTRCDLPMGHKEPHEGIDEEDRLAWFSDDKRAHNCNLSCATSGCPRE